MSDIRLYIDFKSPQAYLAMQPTLRLCERLQVSIDWQPYRTRQLRIELPRDDESRGETHVRVRQQQRHETCLRYADIQGIPMTFPQQPGVTDCALLALLSLAENPQAYIQAAFNAYWCDGYDLDNTEVVKALLRSSGYNASDFDPQVLSGQLDEAQRSAEEAGVFDTPTFVVEDQMFLGREQLSLIESTLS